MYSDKYLSELGEKVSYQITHEQEFILIMFPSEFTRL